MTDTVDSEQSSAQHQRNVFEAARICTIRTPTYVFDNVAIITEFNKEWPGVLQKTRKRLWYQTRRRLQYKRHVIFTSICFSHFTQFVWFLPDSRYDFTVYYKGKAVVNELVLVTFFCGSVIQIQNYHVGMDLLAACFFFNPNVFPYIHKAFLHFCLHLPSGPQHFYQLFIQFSF